MEWVTIFARTVLIYGVIFLVLRLMGKREIGKLSIFDLVISVMIAEIAVFVIEDTEKPLLNGLLPIGLLVAIQIGMSFVTLKSQRLRTWLEGNPSVIVRNGVPDLREMKRQRYNLDDLLQQMREKDVADLADVEFAVLENSGKLSVFRYESEDSGGRRCLPLPLIMDGVVQVAALRQLDKSVAWLRSELRRRGVAQERDVFYCAYRNAGDWTIHLLKDVVSPESRR